MPRQRVQQLFSRPDCQQSKLLPYVGYRLSARGCKFQNSLWNFALMPKSLSPQTTVVPSSTEMRDAFGRSVKALRLKAGMTQGDLGEKCGIGREAISRIENGQFNLTLETMSRVATALDGNVPEMLQSAEDPGSKD